MQQRLKGSGMEVIGRRQRCRLAIFHHSVPPLMIPPSSPVCLYLPPHPQPAGSNSCGRKWRAKVSSHCSICTPARAPLSRLTPAHSSCSAPNYPRRCRVCSPLASAGRRSKGTVRPQKQKSHRMCCPSQCPGSNVWDCCGDSHGQQLRPTDGS